MRNQPAVEDGDVSPAQILPPSYVLGIAFANIKALGAVGQVHQHCGHPGHQASHKGDIALFSIIQMAAAASTFP